MVQIAVYYILWLIVHADAPPYSKASQYTIPCSGSFGKIHNPYDTAQSLFNGIVHKRIGIS